MRDPQEDLFLHEVIQKINKGFSFESLFNSIYEGLRGHIPFNRVSIALLDEEGKILVSRFIRSDKPLILQEGYSSPVPGSSLEPVLSRGDIRVINDLEKHLDEKPGSQSARMMLKEGILSSLTLPLMIDGRPVGAVFFSSRRKQNFKPRHKEFLQKIAGHLAIALDKMNLIERIRRQKSELDNLHQEREHLISKLEETVAERTRELREAYKEVLRLKEQLEGENIYLKEKIEQEYGFKEIVGRSEPLRKALGLVRKAAPTDSSILVRGETGTGKELIARAIHGLSRRKDRTMATVHCAAIPESLISSALFGHEKGAFTGAHARQKGRFEAADGGTLFLDEVGDLPEETQVKLLRVLQEGEFERVGSPETIKVDVRVIAATHSDLEKKIREGTFREDLYYRLNVFPITVPALRERMDDLPELARYFCGLYAKRMGKNISMLSKRTLKTLMAYSWPGNVRELQNIIERAVILCEGSCLNIDGSFFKAPLSRGNSRPADSLIDFERDFIRSALEKTGWTIKGPSGAARLLDMNPSTLYSRIKKLGILKSGKQDDISS